jgi:hypothetical protein
MADNSVRNNSPDPKEYHQNIGGMPGTMIPRSGRDGQSLAFDPNKPQTVIVDPGEDGGGFQLDMSVLAATKTKFNSAAVRSEVAGDVTSFYREVSEGLVEKEQLQEELKTKLQAKLKEPSPMPEPIKPITSLPPVGQPKPKLPSEAEMEAQAAAFDTEGAIDRLLSEEKVKAEQMKEKQRAWSAMAHDAGETPAHLQRQPEEMTEIRASLNKQGEAINALIGVLHRMEEKSAEPPAEQAPPAQEETPEATKAEEVEKLNPFESLKIEFLVEDKPKRPQYETYFEMSKMGTMAARYHAVVVGQQCLALVYDTRFEDGFQYLPPNLGEEKITVSVPKLDDGVYTCSSLGLHWSMGCLDVVILIKHDGVEE